VAAAFDKVGQQGAAIPATAGKLVSLTGQALKEAAGNKVNTACYFKYTSTSTTATIDLSTAW
jgi:hypothetical protein